MGVLKFVSILAIFGTPDADRRNFSSRFVNFETRLSHEYADL
jgi:hypothetical protein